MRADLYILQLLVLTKLKVTKANLESPSRKWTYSACQSEIHSNLKPKLEELQRKYKKTKKREKAYGELFEACIMKKGNPRVNAGEIPSIHHCVVKVDALKTFFRKTQLEFSMTTGLGTDVNILDSFMLYMNCEGIHNLRKRYENSIKKVESKWGLGEEFTDSEEKQLGEEASKISKNRHLEEQSSKPETIEKLEEIGKDLTNLRGKVERAETTSNNQFDKLHEKMDEFLENKAKDVSNSVNDIISSSKGSFSQNLDEDIEEVEIIEEVEEYDKEAYLQRHGSSVEAAKEAAKKPSMFMNYVFNELIDVEKINQDLTNHINIILGKERVDGEIIEWPYRAILASALSLSVLNGWQRQKIDFLKELVERDHEPLVSRRALIGIVLALIESSEREKDFRDSLEIISSLRKDIRYKAGIYEILNFFLNKWTTYNPNSNADSIYSKFEFKFNYQNFEPPHSNSTFLRLKNLAFESKEQERYFFKLLNSTSSLSNVDKMAVHYALNRLNIDQYNDIIEILEQEANSWYQNEDFNFARIQYLHFERSIGDFRFLINKYAAYRKATEKITQCIEKVKTKSIAERLFHQFPYFGYFTILGIDKILDENAYLIKDKGFQKFIGDSLINNAIEKSSISGYEEAIMLTERIMHNYENSYLEYIIGECFEKIAKLSDKRGKKKMYENAIEKYEKALKIQEFKNDFLFSKIARCLNEIAKQAPERKRKNLLEEVRKNYERSLELSESNENSYVFLADCLIELANYSPKKNQKSLFEEAKKNYEKYIEIKGESVLALNQITGCIIEICNRSPLEERKELYENIVLLYKRCIDIEKDNSYYYEQLGNCLVKLAWISVEEDRKRLYIEAKANYALYLNKNGNNPEVYYYRGMCNFEIANLSTEEERKSLYKTAISDYKIYLEYGGRIAMVYFYLGMCRFEMANLSIEESRKGLYEEAKDSYEMYLENGTDGAMVNFYLGVCLLEISVLSVQEYQFKFLEDAKVWFGKAIEMGMNNSDGYLLLAESYFNKAGSFIEQVREVLLKEAETMYKKSIEKREKKSYVQYKLGRCYFLLSSPREAKQWFKKVFGKEDEEYAHMNYAHCELILGNRKSALKHYKRSLDFWKCSKEFFNGFDDDFQYMQPQGVSEEEYESVKKELEKYCEGKNLL